MQILPTNIRYALRQFRLAPVFSAAAILTLALGIGGTTAIFTLIHAVMLRSLPVADPATLYRIGDGDDCCVESGPQNRWGMYSYALYQRLKENAPEFYELAAFKAGRATVSVRRQGVESVARPVRTEYVTGNYFSTFGLSAFGGRVFTMDDDQPNSAPVAVISHRIWQNTYGGDPTVVGSTFVVQGHPFTVIGIAPPGFFGETLRADPADLWVPVNQEPLVDGNGGVLHSTASAWLRVIGRARPGANIAPVAPRLTGVVRQWIQHESGYPSNWMPDIIRTLDKQIVNVVPAGAGVAEMKEEFSRSLQILLSVCGLVLLIACANVANLQLARAVARRSQTAVRLALGANRGQIIKEALTESILLAVAGGIAGLVVAVGATRLLLMITFRNAHFLPISATPSLLVLAFAFVLSLLTGIIFGATPAWFATRTDPADALRGTGRGNTDRSSFARKALLIVQAAFSIVLVAGATMLARSLNNLEHQNFGYPILGRVEVTILSPPSTYTVPQLNSLYRQLQERLTQNPGVQSANLALYNPLTDNWGELIYVAGHPPQKIDNDSGSSWNRVTNNYLQDLGVQLVRGRYFNSADNENSENVAVVNEHFVKNFFKNGENPIDQHFGMDLPEYQGTFRIVGVVKDARFAGWGMRRPPLPMFYVPLAQSVAYHDPLMSRVETQSHFAEGILLNTNLPKGQIESFVTKTLSDVDPNLTITNVITLEERVQLTFDEERATASLAGAFGIIALMLAAIGLYGVTAYTVAQRTNEIGIRMALGANRGRVMQLVLRGAFRRVLIGLVIGLPLAIGAGKLITAQLYGVKSWDPIALLIAAGALAVCSFIAAMIPANRAASISPMQALRIE